MQVDNKYSESRTHSFLEISSSLSNGVLSNLSAWSFVYAVNNVSTDIEKYWKKNIEGITEKTYLFIVIMRF